MVHLFGVQNSQISCKYPQQRSLEFWHHHRLKLGPPPSLPALELEAGELAARNTVWKKWPVADLSRKNLFNHLCDLNLRTETWPDLTSHQKWQIAARGKASVKPSPKDNKQSYVPWRFLHVAVRRPGFECGEREWSGSSDLLFGGKKVNIPKFTFIWGINNRLSMHSHFFLFHISEGLTVLFSTKYQWWYCWNKLQCNVYNIFVMIH